MQNDPNLNAEIENVDEVFMTNIDQEQISEKKTENNREDMDEIEERSDYIQSEQNASTSMKPYLNFLLNLFIETPITWKPASSTASL